MNTVASALERARVAKTLGRAEEARRIVGQALIDAPDDADLLVWLADYESDQERYDEASRLIGAAFAADPDHVGAHITAALVQLGRDDPDGALRIARRAVSLDPNSLSALVTLVSVIAHTPKFKRLKAEARSALETAARLYPDSAEAHAVLADRYRELGDLDAERRHIDAGLQADPLHADMLARRAEREPSRGKAVATLRGLLGSQPSHTPARQLLAAIMWRALMRLAVWVWFFAVMVTLASLWIGPGALRFLTPVLWLFIPFAWWGVFRVLRRQLPPGYLRTRLRRRPGAIVALVLLVPSSLLADLGAMMLRMDWSAGFVRAAYVLLLMGAAGAGIAHLLLFRAWIRRNHGEEDWNNSFALTGVDLIITLLAALVAAIAVAAGGYWARQPFAIWVLLTLLCGIAVVILLEGLVALVLDLGTPDTLPWRAWPRVAWVALVVIAALAASLPLGLWWGASHLTTAPVHSENRGPIRKTPEPLRPRQIEMPTLRLTVPPVPPGER
ncbi:tetratricopeptide repeat protein [Nocardia sp. NPDC051832]|uniref:tetratricopeptide repeat protein n=1 Tax=Nocardia sp. NPDC051832 TaxID=3155673 RepID=UPI003418060E